ncbi:MAG TPA: hypothetical protein VN809_10480 [Telmatospirillum sp.]|nr:hypothetical protein [Telmatospirillum sp.]
MSGMIRGTCALTLCLVLFVGACATTSSPTNDASREEMEEFQQSIQDSAQKIGDYIKLTQRGDNISELMLGWFVYDILTEISSQDNDLYKYFNNDDKDLQTYLKINFRDHPVAEIAALDRLAKHGHPTFRLSARYALETLRHIPNAAEPEETQIRDRRELASALATLQDLLEKCAREVVLPPP